MPGPMTPAQIMRDSEIIAKEKAVKSRLDAFNDKGKFKAQAQIAGDLSKQRAKGNKSGYTAESYTTKSILGADKGFSKSDYGAGNGAAIPYQVGTDTKTISGSYGMKKVNANAPFGKARAQAIARRFQNTGQEG